MTEERHPPKYLIIGEVLRPHAIQGELRIRILTDYPERIVPGKTLYLGSAIDATDIVPYTVESFRTNKEFGLLKLRKIDTRDQADLLRQLLVLTDFEDAVPLEEGEFYLYELIGIEVQTDSGELLGTVVDVLETGANDVYVLDSPRYGEVLIPVTDETILKTDMDARMITVKLPEGLLPF
jgi:16S rRNA processing protein RimM